METGPYIWSIAVIGGPILLGLAIAYAVTRRRRRRSRQRPAAHVEGSDRPGER